MMGLLRILAISAATSLFAGCKGGGSLHLEKNGNFVAECAGHLSVNVTFSAAPPTAVAVTWQGIQILNECTGSVNGNVTLLHNGNSLILQEGSFGYTAPQPLSVQIMDCNNGSVLYTLSNHLYSAQAPALCESFNLQFNQ